MDTVSTVTLSRTVQLVAAIALTIGLGYFIWRQIDIDIFVALLRSINPWLISLIVGVYFVYQLARAWRLQILLAMDGGSFPALASTVCVQGAIAVLLPLWLGEVAIILLLRNRHAVKLASGTASMLLARGVDFLVHIVLFIAVIVVYHALIPEPIMRYALAFSLVLLLPILAVGLLVLLGRASALEKIGPGSRATSALAATAAALKTMVGSRVLAPFLALTALMAALLFAFFHLIMLALGMGGDVGETWFVYSMLAPLSSIPVKGIADIGTHETAWFFLLRLLDVPSELAAAVAVGSHIIILVAVAITFIIGIAGLSVVPRAAGKVPP